MRLSGLLADAHSSEQKEHAITTFSPAIKALKPHAAGMRIDNQDRAVEIVVYGQSARVGGCLCYPLKRVFCGDHGRVQIKGVDLRSLRTFHGLF